MVSSCLSCVRFLAMYLLFVWHTERYGVRTDLQFVSRLSSGGVYICALHYARACVRACEKLKTLKKSSNKPVALMVAYLLLSFWDYSEFVVRTVMDDGSGTRWV